MDLQAQTFKKFTLPAKDVGSLWWPHIVGGCSKFFYAFFSLLVPLAGIPQRYLLFVFISSFYFGISIIYLAGGVLSLADIAFFLLACAFFSFLLYRSDFPPHGTFRSKRVLGMVLLFFFWCSISMIVNLFNSSWDTGLNSIWFTIRLAELPVGLYIFSSKGASRYRESILDFIIFYSIVEIIVSLFQHFLLHKALSVGTFHTHHAMVAIMMAPSAAISLYRYLIRKTLLWKIFYGTVFSLSIYIIILSQCRSMLVGVVIAIVLFFLKTIKFKMRYFIYIACTIAVVAVAVKVTPLGEIFYKTIHSSDTPASAIDISSYGRLMIWQGAITHFMHASSFEKLAGVGMGSFSTVRFNFFVFERKGSSGGHNNFLQVLIETGVIGLILFICLFFSICRALLQSAKNDALAMPFFYATIALLASCFTQETFWFQYVFGDCWLFNMVIVGLILGYQSDERGSVSSKYQGIKGLP